MKTKNSQYSLINKYTSVLFCFIYICKQVYVFTNKKATVCTDMYKKEEWITWSLPLSNQSEVKKSLELWRDRKLYPYIPNVQPDMHLDLENTMIIF